MRQDDAPRKRWCFFSLHPRGIWIRYSPPHETVSSHGDEDDDDDNDGDDDSDDDDEDDVYAKVLVDKDTRKGKLEEWTLSI